MQKFNNYPSIQVKTKHNARSFYFSLVSYGYARTLLRNLDSSEARHSRKQCQKLIFCMNILQIHQHRFNSQFPDEMKVDKTVSIFKKTSKEITLKAKRVAAGLQIYCPLPLNCLKRVYQSNQQVSMTISSQIINLDLEKATGYRAQQRLITLLEFGKRLSIDCAQNKV